MKNNNLMLILVILFIGFVSAAQGGPNGNSSMNGQGNQFSHGGVNANCAICGENMNQNRTRFNVSLSNGRNSEIKIMPDNASQTALQRLRLRNCSEENMCQIELREVGSGENVKAAYELKTQRHSRVFGIFNKKMQVSAQIDAETGELININKPWWAFLASEPEEI